MCSSYNALTTTKMLLEILSEYLPPTTTTSHCTFSGISFNLSVNCFVLFIQLLSVDVVQVMCGLEIKVLRIV